MPWPARSPDLNPIENIWAVLDRKMTSYNVTSIEHLKHCLHQEWLQIPVSLCEKLIASMKKRVKACYLAKGGYFNKTLCHRLTTNGLYVLQCGDPTASGKGGPLFTYDDENLPQAVANNYPAGTVAMANSGLTQTGHGTNGSQFFLVYADTTLGANYTRWGPIVKGLDILKAVAAQGVLGGGTDGTPKQAVGIEKVSVK